MRYACIIKAKLVFQGHLPEPTAEEGAPNLRDLLPLLVQWLQSPRAKKGTNAALAASPCPRSTWLL